MTRNCFKLTLIISIIWFSLYSCINEEQKAIRQSAEIDSVRTAIHNSIAWAGKKDFNLLYRIIANDSNYLEVDPGLKIIRGFEQFKNMEQVWRSADFKAVRYDIRELKITFSERGDVSWFYCILDDVSEWKKQQVSWINTRWTGVLEKRKGKWVIVQMHFSFAQK
ncbi:MAG TPA: nuclear transport factor 2 family protein [Bacteroidales bacterium]|jgi:hypothetical protein|nr:nuclear transport factor 2 family protein [Bacteroidales bacterium]